MRDTSRKYQGAFPAARTVLLALTALAFTAQADNAAAQKRHELGLAGAGPASLAYTLTAGVAENTNRRTKLVRVTAETSAGFVQNVRLVGKGETEMALISGSQVFEGLRAIGPFKGEAPYQDLRGVAVAYTGTASWNAREGITSVPELAGKTVSLGPPGSLIAHMGEAILEAYGIKDKVTLLRLSFSESSRAFVDGRIDAFMGGPAPYPAVMEAGAQKAITILPVDAEHVKKIQASAPVISETITAGSYDWQKNDIPALGFLAYIVANKSVADEAIHEILRVNLSDEGIAYLKNNHRVWGIWNTPRYIEQQGAFALEGMKMHPGAVKYWTEKGVKIPEKVMP